ncbi:hypothetical protein NQ315_008361 [Exocentrus adspersus]|uniref:Uncharacterized protein n=1 Tax=Exocentrus adspersus TaxID=1586481 RepID=A0AAV8VTB7_9CUCU|nr:hypothetical protein NQ315_008361 [Exocentrus adspersus]
MMMMDISMYGHHNQHSAVYNSSDSNYYNNYSSELNHSSTHHQFQTHYTSNYHYEEPSYLYGATVGDTVDTPPSPQDLNYYHPQQIQENPIINTDTGLSYTNLDYANSNSNSIYHHPTGYNENYRTHPPDVLMQHHDERSDSHHLHHNYTPDSKYHSHQVELEGNYHHPHLVTSNATSNSCMEFQHLHRFKDEVLQSPEGHRLRQHHPMHSLNTVPQPQPVLPTYKWMQVKRNVPKPAACKIIRSPHISPLAFGRSKPLKLSVSAQWNGVPPPPHSPRP